MTRQGQLPFGPPDPVARPHAHPFLAQLAELCRREVTCAKWVIVPSHHVGHAIGEALVLGGTDWVNLRFVTPLDLAIRTAAPLLLDRGIDPSEESLGPALVMHLLEAGEGTYFGPLAQQSSLARALWGTLRELRYAGLSAQQLPRAAFASTAKHAEMTALLAAYAAHLETRRLADMAAVFEAAPGDLRYCPIRASDIVIECPDAPVPPVVRRFLDLLPGQRMTPETVEVPNLDPSVPWTRLAAGALSVGPAALLPAGSGGGTARRDAERLLYLRDPAGAGPARGDGSIAIFHAGGVEAELDEVFRRVLGAGRGLDAVDLVCATPALAHLAWEKAVTLGWPVTVACGLPATQSRPGRALLGWVTWLRNRFSAADLRRLLESGDVAVREWRNGAAGTEPDRLSAGSAARVLQRAEATWGRETYAIALGGLADSSDSRAARLDPGDDQRASLARRASRARHLADWVDGLLAAVPETDADGAAPLGELVAAARGFLDACAAVHNPLDRAAVDAIGEALAALDALAFRRRPFQEALGFIVEAVEQSTVGRDRARPGHLHVSVLGATVFETRPIVFFAGLEEGRVFPSLVEDPVLLDEERAAVSAAAGLPGGLPGAADRLRDAVHRGVLHVVTAGLCAEQVTFSYSCRETREGRDTFPSWVVLQAHRLRASAPGDTYQQLAQALGEPASPVPVRREEAASAAQWWLASARAGEPARLAVCRAYPTLAAAAAAGAARAAEAFGPYDGYVGDAAPSLDLACADRVLSATTLQDASACPFRYFLRYGLGLEVVEEREPDPDVWLDPLLRGSALHEVYAALSRRASSRGGGVTVEADLAWVLADASARLDALARTVPPPSGEVAAREREDFLADVEAFVREESEDREVTGEAFEVSYGTEVRDGDDPLAIADTVAVPIGPGRLVRLRGRLDRLDRLADGNWQVVDYKTGGFWPSAWQGTFAGGTRLQHALYAVAGDEVLRRAGRPGRVVRSVYRFPTARGRGQRVEIARPGDAAVRDVLGRLGDVVREGAFVQAPDKEACRFCTFTGACGREPWVRAHAKLAAGGDGPLAAFVRLREVP